MADVIASPRQDLPKKLPALPVIEHPGLRRSEENNDLLQIRGNSREATAIVEEGNDSLPPLRRRTSQQGRKGHSRVLTWPLGQGKGKTSNSSGPALEKPSHKLSAEELEDLIREKLLTRISGLRQLFRSNDPMGKGNVSREALANILYHLCGYLTSDQISGVLKRLGLDTQSTISFENFVHHFQDNETLTKEWVDPVLRPPSHFNYLANLPANRLRQRQREIALEQKHAVHKQGQKKTPPKLFSALEVFPQLKRRVQQGTLPYAKLLPPSCFDADGMVLKPQLRTALQVLGYQMYEEEFEKVWDRFDKTGLGAVNSVVFFKTLGVNPFYEFPEKVKQLPSTEPEKEEEEQKVSSEKEHDDEEEVRLHSAHAEAGRDLPQEEKSTSAGQNRVLTLFAEKFKEGYTQVVNSFKKYDPEDTGQMSKADFRKALSEYRLQLGPVETEHFLQRCGMREHSMVPYKKLMDLYLDRSEKGQLQAVLDDPKHRFNRSRDSALGSTTAFDAEARLLDIIQADFLALLGAFKQLDRDNLGVIKRYQFKELLEARFKMKVTDDELTSVLRPLLEDTNHSLIPYARFLELFSSPRQHKEVSINVKIPSPSTANVKPTTSPKDFNSPRRPLSRKSQERSASHTETAKKESQPRNLLQLFSLVREILTEKFQVIQKTFQGMDQLKKGYLSKGMFLRLFERYELKFTSPEVDLLWSKLPVEKDGMVSFAHLVEFSFLNFNVTTAGEESGQAASGCLSRVLQDYAKSLSHNRLESVAEEKDVDSDSFPTPPSVVAQEDQAESPTEDKTLPPLKTQNKLSVEEILKSIKQQVCSQWSEMRNAFNAVDKEGSATLEFDDFKGVMKRFCKDMTDEECLSLCWKFDRRKNSRVCYLEFLKKFLPTMPVKVDHLGPMAPVTRYLTKAAWLDGKRAQEAVDTVVDKIRNQMISDWKGLRRAFRKMDSLGDGFVSVTDFKATMYRFNFPLNEEDFFHIFSVFDENMEGRISYVEFMRRSLSE